MKSLAYFLIGLGVCAGAFGAHGLKDVVTPERLDVFKTASNYQIAMSIVLLIVSQDSNISRKVVYLFLAGIIIFSGSLYLLVLLNLPILGAITPLGGVSIITSLFIAAFTSWKNQSSKKS